jgi:hypothetical protein
MEKRQLHAFYSEVGSQPSNHRANESTQQICLSYFPFKAMSGFIRVSYKLYSDKQTAFNAAMAYNLANAISGTYPDYSIDLSKVLVSRGALPAEVNAQATSANGAINLTWENNSGVGSAKQTDKALVVVYNDTKGLAVYETADVERMVATDTISIPSDWVEDSVDLFLGFMSEDGKEVSNSVYLGTITVA